MSAKTPKELRDAFCFLYPGELEELARITKLLPPDPVIVNIGAGVGTSGSIFLSSRPDSRLITVDIQGGVSPHGGIGNERGALAAMGLIPGRFYVPITGDSKAVGKAWKRPQVEAIFVDGDHTYEGCKGDFDAWLPHLKPGGYLMVHDYGKIEHYRQLHGVEIMTPEDIAEAKPYPGVDQATDELRGHMEFISHIESLAVFRKPEA